MEYVKYYMALIYVRFYDVGEGCDGYQDYVRAFLEEVKQEFGEVWNMETIEIVGDNYFGAWDEVRVACRGIVVKDGLILLNYETKIDQYDIIRRLYVT